MFFACRAYLQEFFHSFPNDYPFICRNISITCMISCKTAMCTAYLHFANVFIIFRPSKLEKAAFRH